MCILTMVLHGLFYWVPHWLYSQRVLSLVTGLALESGKRVMTFKWLTALSLIFHAWFLLGILNGNILATCLDFPGKGCVLLTVSITLGWRWNVASHCYAYNHSLPGVKHHCLVSIGLFLVNKFCNSLSSFQFWYEKEWLSYHRIAQGFGIPVEHDHFVGHVTASNTSNPGWLFLDHLWGKSSISSLFSMGYHFSMVLGGIIPVSETNCWGPFQEIIS